VYARRVATFRYVVIDVFTDKPLAGNQLAVFTDAREIPEKMLQPLAKEMAFSETVFVYPPTPPEPADEKALQGALDRENEDETVFVLPPEAGGHARIRIFTPAAELPFAGHPVLGSAFVLGAPLQLGEIRLETGAGVIPVTLEREGARIIFGRMQQPIPNWKPFDKAEELQELLGVRSQLPVEVYDLGPHHVYLELGSEAEVAAVAPDFGALGRLTHVGVNCFAGSGMRWKTRMFAPASGVAEDPATGSACGPLGIHLVRHGRIGFGEEVEVSQGDEIGRPSKLYVRVDGSPEQIERVEVGGSAVVVARGEFRL
jgi:trans-2,3-dihydro-3-hydroxyanthranilate isomerase